MLPDPDVKKKSSALALSVLLEDFTDRDSPGEWDPLLELLGSISMKSENALCTILKAMEDSTNRDELRKSQRSRNLLTFLQIYRPILLALQCLSLCLEDQKTYIIPRFGWYPDLDLHL
jgi:hypothetical protein